MWACEHCFKIWKMWTFKFEPCWEWKQVYHGLRKPDKRPQVRPWAVLYRLYTVHTNRKAKKVWLTISSKSPSIVSWILTLGSVCVSAWDEEKSRECCKTECVFPCGLRKKDERRRWTLSLGETTWQNIERHKSLLHDRLIEICRHPLLEEKWCRGKWK